MNIFTYPGNIHIHSTYSDGSGDFEQISKAAAAAGLKYVVITDHETLAGLAEESIRHGVIILVGVEINLSHSHYVALDISDTVEPDEDNPQRVIDAVNKVGGLGFIAHPFEKGSVFIEKGKAYPWKHWPVFRFQGIEIWNYTSHWRGRHPSLFRTLYWFLLNRKGAMNAPPDELLKLWDCYNNNGHRITAIGSSDAHAFPYRFGFIRVEVFPYRYIFSTINTYIVLESELKNEFTSDKEQIIGALRKGNCYISFDSLQKGTDFKFYATSDDNLYLMGSELAYEDRMLLHIKVPAKKQLIRLIRNGQVIVEKYADHLEYHPEKSGIYRAEVHYKPLCRSPRPWIYSNPIYLGQSGD